MPHEQRPAVMVAHNQVAPMDPASTKTAISSGFDGAAQSLRLSRTERACTIAPTNTAFMVGDLALAGDGSSYFTEVRGTANDLFGVARRPAVRPDAAHARGATLAEPHSTSVARCGGWSNSIASSGPSFKASSPIAWFDSSGTGRSGASPLHQRANGNELIYRWRVTGRDGK